MAVIISYNAFCPFCEKDHPDSTVEVFKFYPNGDPQETRFECATCGREVIEWFDEEVAADLREFMSPRTFEVTWSINVEATSPETAAMDAREIMLDPATVATIMVVRPEGEEYPAHVFDLAEPNAPALVTVEREVK